MKDLKGKEIILVIGVSVLVIFFAYYLLYMPKYQQIAKLQKEIRKLHKEIEEIEAMVIRVPNPKREMEILQDRLQKLKEKATDKEQVPLILQQLLQKTSELKIEIISIKPREDIKEVSSDLPEGVSKVYMQVKVRCPYRTLVNYIEALNNLPLLFTIEDLSVEKSKTSITEDLEIMLLLSTYVMA